MIVLTNLPDRRSALDLARGLVERRLAACVNVLGDVVSVYRWQGTVATENEVTVLIKTRAPLYTEVEAAIAAAHPYELPEVIAFAVERGLPDYLKWVIAETGPE